MASHLYAIHDPAQDWPAMVRDAGMTGWAVISEEIGDDPANYSGGDYSWLASYGVTPIVRLNYSHHGEGTIPLPDRYPQFAARCANFVVASSGCVHFVIANEPNLYSERCQGVPILPHQYADCFARCRQAIKQRGTHHQVIPAAVAPYNADTGWCMDYWAEMLGAIALSASDGGADGLALHTYSRGGDLSSIDSEAKMGAPYQAYYNGFRAYRDFLAFVPAVMRGLPAYITESDQLDPWVDANSGWVRAAYAEIDEWNQTGGNQGIHCLALYRWENYDQWGFKDKRGVVDDFRAALTFDMQAPAEGFAPDPEPIPDPPPRPEPERDMDPALIARGVHLTPADVAEGEWFWQAYHLEWLDVQEADAAGPDHHILGNAWKDHRIAADVPFHISWPNGATTVVSKTPQPHIPYNYDFPMTASLNEFSIRAGDGAPSDLVSGIGMGMMGNPAEHTSTWIDWRFVQKGEPPAPIPPHHDIQTGYVTASAGLNVREGPGTTYPVLGTLAHASTVLYDEDQSGWLHVVDGWVSGEYVSSETFEGVEPPVLPGPTEGGTQPLAPAGDGHLIWPVRNARITQRFGEHFEYYLEQFDALGHNGLDFGVETGSPIVATADGIVTMAGDDKPGYGRFLRLYHPALRLGSLYAHCHELLVAEGDSVTQGQQIATVGSTGNSSGPHLHWELCAQDVNGYVNVSYGHSKGRANPEIIMWLMGISPTYEG